MAAVVAGAAAVALLALFDTAWPGADETTLGSGAVRLVDRAADLPAPPKPLTPRIQKIDDCGGDNDTVDADDSDQQEQQLQENNGLQTMIQSEQQAEEQNDQAEQQFTQDELQAQQTEQQADP